MIHFIIPGIHHGVGVITHRIGIVGAHFFGTITISIVIILTDGIDPIITFQTETVFRITTMDGIPKTENVQIPITKIDRMAFMIKPIRGNPLLENPLPMSPCKVVQP